MRSSAMNRVTSWSRTVAMVATAAVLATASLAAASTNVLMMPDRQALVGTSVVVWGNTRFAVDSTYMLDFGDTSAVESGTVTDPTYIFTSHTYAAPGTYIARLTVTDATPTTESETVTITVQDPTALTEFDLRALRINMTIEEGLRWLYVHQSDRTTADTTTWIWDDDVSAASLAALAFQNHGHLVTSDPTKDIYQAVVQRALNYIFDNLTTTQLTVELTDLNPAGNDPCVGTGIEPAPCTGLNPESTTGYTTSMATLAVAGAVSSDPTRVVGAGLGSRNGNFVAGKAYSEILQRQVNTIAWGQMNTGFEAGGWRYTLNYSSDGSAIGWAVLALFDGGAAGAMVSPFIATELANVIATTACSDNAGELTLTYDNSRNGGTCDGSQNVAKAGILLQALNFMNVPVTDARVQGALTYISNKWAGGDTSTYFRCDTGDNKGCAYSMFNTFKGLRLYNIATLPGVNRAAGPGTIPLNDWYEDYRDFLVTSQNDPTGPMGGNWQYPTMDWSCCSSASLGITAVAEIILSPTALVLPSHLTLTPETATNPLGTSHTVTATATTVSGSPAPGATVTFRVISGPDAGVAGTSTTDADGRASFTYTNSLSEGTDQIQANIGSTLQSNVVVKIWTAFDPFGGLVRTNSRNIKLKLHRPPGARGVRCVETTNPKNPDFSNLPFTPFPEGSDDVELDITLSDGLGNKTVCCQFDTGEEPTVPVCDSIELVSTTSTTLPKTEDCNNCIDDDGDGLVDYDDPDCCAQPAALEVFRGSFKGLAKKGKGRLRLRSRLGPIGITEQTPLSEDTTIQFSNANGQLLCATVGHEHWMPMHGDTKFWDRSGALAKGLQDGTIHVKRDGTVIFRTYSNIMDLSSYNKPQLKVTVRVGNKCSRGTVALRQRKDRLVVP